MKFKIMKYLNFLKFLNSSFLLSSIRRKYWNRENFRPPFFDGFTRFGGS